MIIFNKHRCIYNRNIYTHMNKPIKKTKLYLVHVYTCDEIPNCFVNLACRKF